MLQIVKASEMPSHLYDVHCVLFTDSEHELQWMRDNGAMTMTTSSPFYCVFHLQFVVLKYVLLLDIDLFCLLLFS